MKLWPKRIAQHRQFAGGNGHLDIADDIAGALQPVKAPIQLAGGTIKVKDELRTEFELFLK